MKLPCQGNRVVPWSPLTALRFLLPMMFVISDAQAVRPYLLMEWAAGAKVGHSFIHVAE